MSKTIQEQFISKGIICGICKQPFNDIGAQFCMLGKKYACESCMRKLCPDMFDEDIRPEDIDPLPPELQKELAFWFIRC